MERDFVSRFNYINKIYEKDREFMEVTSREFVEGQSFEDYKRDVKKWLMLSDWYYSEESAKRIVDTYEHFIEEVYLNKNCVEYIGIDIGYSCG